MLLRYSYSTLITFSDKVIDHTFALRCVPMETASQHVVSQQLTVIPACTVSQSIDAFGNIALSGYLGRRHDIFAYEASGVVLTSTDKAAQGIESSEKIALYSYQTNLTRPSDEMVRLAHTIGGPLDSKEWILNIISLIDKHFEYRQGVTTIETSAAQAWELGCGVCQDYAHVAIALCRLLNVPARYVCGLMQGEGATHAWVEVYYDAHWIAFDPTNHRLVDGTYIKMAHGRDYSDCSISRGAFRGNAQQNVHVSVDVWEERIR